MELLAHNHDNEIIIQFNCDETNATDELRACFDVGELIITFILVSCIISL